MDALSDEQIVSRIVERGEDLFPRLLRRYQTGSYTTSARVVGGREEALDLSQEIFLKVYQALRHLQLGIQSFHIDLDHLERRDRLPEKTEDPDGFHGFPASRIGGGEGPVREFPSPGPRSASAISGTPSAGSPFAREIAALSPGLSGS